MAQALALQADHSRSTQHARNISALQTGADVTCSALKQIKNIPDRAGESASLADGAKTPAQLQTFASEVNQLIQQAVQPGADVTQAITALSQVQSTYQAALSSSSVLLQLQQSVLKYL